MTHISRVSFISACSEWHRSVSVASCSVCTATLVVGSSRLTGEPRAAETRSVNLLSDCMATVERDGGDSDRGSCSAEGTM